MSAWRTYASSDELGSFDELLARIEEVRARGGVIVTTNGCFDIVHSGHVKLLREARACGDILIVAINSDASARSLKGAGRPVVAESDRAAVLLAMRAVDDVVAFDERTPNRLLRSLRPTVHCKGGDYEGASLPEAKVVAEGGGEVRILGFHGDHSTTSVVERATQAAVAPHEAAGNRDPQSAEVAARLVKVARIVELTAAKAIDSLVSAARALARVIESDGTVFLCGNGGSATQAQHVAAELVGRFRREGFVAPAVALSTDAAVVTALANDFGFENVFARQLEALGRTGDALVAITTSGRSANVLRAAEVARTRGLVVIGVTGASPGSLADHCDHLVSIPSHDTSTVQVSHLAALHELCELVEDSAPNTVDAVEVPRL